MADHQLKDIADGAVSRLTTVLSGGGTPLYPAATISITKGLFRPAYLPAFTKHLIRVAPAANPWTERTIGIRYFQRVYRFDVFLLCKVTDEDLSLWGEGSDSTKGVLQLVEDVKLALRGNGLGLTFVDPTYNEVVGDVLLDQAAAPGFESAERVEVHRARLLYTVCTKPFCVSI